jgi:hypothetical protein
MLDASIRRFKIQQTYLKASAALRWVNSRNAILGANRPQAIHTPALQQITNTMRAVSFSSLTCFFFGCYLHEARGCMTRTVQLGPQHKQSTDTALLAGTCIGDTSSGRASSAISGQHSGEMACRGPDMEHHGRKHSEPPMIASIT